MNVAEFLQLVLLIHDACERAINYMQSTTHHYRTQVELELSKLTAILLADTLIESHNLAMGIDDEDYNTWRGHVRQIMWRMESALWCCKGLESIPATKSVAYLIMQVHNNAEAAAAIIDKSGVLNEDGMTSFERAFEQLKNTNPGDLHL